VKRATSVVTLLSRSHVAHKFRLAVPTVLKFTVATDRLTMYISLILYWYFRDNDFCAAFVS